MADSTLYKSQMGQDRLLNEQLFKGKRDGVFVDVGAHDGVSLSNTYFFEKALGWTGICVEPIAARFKDLVSNRPKSICVHGCAYHTTGNVQFREVTGYPEMLSGIEATYNAEHKQRILHEIQTKGGAFNIVTQKAYRVADLLKEHKIQHVDYMSIDTEGSEINVLRGIDFQGADIRVIEVENNYPADKTVENFLKSRGYRLFTKIQWDDVFIKI